MISANFHVQNKLHAYFQANWSVGLNICNSHGIYWKCIDIIWFKKQNRVEKLTDLFFLLLLFSDGKWLYMEEWMDTAGILYSWTYLTTIDRVLIEYCFSFFLWCLCYLRRTVTSAIRLRRGKWRSGSLYACTFRSGPRKHYYWSQHPQPAHWAFLQGPVYRVYTSILRPLPVTWREWGARFSQWRSRVCPSLCVSATYADCIGQICRAL